MTPPERRPLQYPPGVHLPFVGPDYVQRLAKQCMLGPHSRVLFLGAGGGAAEAAAWLARNVDPELVLADASEEVLAQARARLEQDSLTQRTWFQQVDPSALPWGDGEFSSIWVDAQTFGALQPAAKALRRHLVLKGRLCLQWPVRVSRQPDAPQVQAWEARMGDVLLPPRDCLQRLAETGYEPQVLECLSDPELASFYKQVEAASPPAGSGWAEDLSFFRAQNGRSAVSFVVMVGRRKEPGEKPPPSRSE